MENRGAAQRLQFVRSFLSRTLFAGSIDACARDRQKEVEDLSGVNDIAIGC